MTGHDNTSVLRRFGDDDHSSYATADDGDDSSQDCSRICNDILKQSNDGQVDIGQPTTRRITDTLSIRKRRQTNRADTTAEDSSLARPKGKSYPRTGRTRLPTIWRSGSGSWDVQASLPRRISSTLRYPSRTASASIPEASVPMPVCEEIITGNEFGFLTGDTAGASQIKAKHRTTLQKSKAEESAELDGKQTHDAR